MRIQTNLINLADQLFSLTRNNNGVNDEIALARQKFKSRDDPSVQLYGLSQAGKSTFLSCLTLGEQFIPIGTGTATTAVVIELIDADPQSKNQATVRWLDPEEIQELVEQPLRYFSEDYEAFKEKRDKKKSHPGRRSTRTIDRFRQRTEPLLNSHEYRDHLWNILTAAHRARQDETNKKVGEDNDLAVTEIILRHYDSYTKEYRPGFQRILNLAELAEWTRQPINWGKWDEKSLASYEFSQVKSFFTKTVRLYTTVQRTAQGLTILDAPGFGISNIHDRICRSAQIGAEAVFLIVGQQIGQDQMREMQQLSAGLKDNLFVIWNSKDGTERNAQELLNTALTKLRNEAGLVIPKERTGVANLHLALRAMQWRSLQAGRKLKEQTEESLKERFSSIYKFDPSKHKIESGIKRELREAIGKFTNVFDFEEVDGALLNDALNLSGWQEVVKLLSKAKEIPQKEKQLRFALSLVNASIRYLEGFPATKEIRELNQAIEALNNIAHKLRTSIIKKNRRDMENELESEAIRVFEEFLDYITDPQELRNLKSSLTQKINGAVHYSTVPAKLIAGIDDYVRARSGVWLKKIVEFETVAGRECILAPYNIATFEIAQWIKKEWAEQSQLNGSFELPSASPPTLKLEDFRLEFIAWNKVLAEKAFSSGWIESSVTLILESVKKAWSSAKQKTSSWWNKTKSWWYETDNKVSPPAGKPSFDRSKAIREMKEKIDAHFSKRAIKGLYELGEDQTSFFNAASNRKDTSYESWADVIADYIETKNINFWWECCNKLYSSWNNASDQMKHSLDAAFESWANSVEPILKERVRNLSSKSPEPVLLETLIEIERLFESSEVAEFEDATLGGVMSQLNRVIAARKVES